MLAEAGARDYKGHKLCVQCWNQLPELAPIKAETKNKLVVRRRVVKQHKCAGGACECPCRIMDLEQRVKPKRDYSQQMLLPGGTGMIDV